MAASKNTIRVWTSVEKKESVASGSITPGMAVERVQNSEVVRAMASAAVAMYPFMIAEEDELQGKEITDAYTTGTKVYFMAPQRGDLVMALVADGQFITLNDLLESAGSGLFRKYVAGIPLLRAREGKNLLATANVSNEHVLCEVL